jgi:hypothetical protein
MVAVGQTRPTWPRRHVDLCPLSAKSGDPNVFSVNTPFWKIRVTRVQQKIFHREFSVSAKHFGRSGPAGCGYGIATLLTTSGSYIRLLAASLIEGVSGGDPKAERGVASCGGRSQPFASGGRDPARQALRPGREELAITEPPAEAQAEVDDGEGSAGPGSPKSPRWSAGRRASRVMGRKAPHSA